MNFHDWHRSDDYKAKQFRMCIHASGDDMQGDIYSEQMKAAGHAYSAGIEEGKRQAAQTLSSLVIGEVRFR